MRRIENSDSRKPSFTVLRVAALVAAVVALPAPAAAQQPTRVHAGDSIQAAVDAARPGDVIHVDRGIYLEQVVIETDGISLVGAGASESGTVLLPPVARQETNCSAGTTFQDGICILSADGVTVKGFVIRGFPDGGLTALYAPNVTVKDVWADDNFVGIFSEGTDGAKLADNVASSNTGPGIMLWSSPAANASLTDNDVYENLVGILAEDSSHGSISDNYAHDNCLGIALTDVGGGASHWQVTNNRANHNNKACPPDSAFPGSPAVSGGGIGIQGATHSTVEDNEVLDNRPAFDNRFAGGIEVHSTTHAGGSEPIDVLIKNNDVHRNLPYDLGWDGTGSPIFEHNRCESSSPPGLCGPRAKP